VISYHFAVFPTPASPPVWPGRYPFFCFDSYLEFDLEALLSCFRLIVTFFEVFAPTAFWFQSGFLISEFASFGKGYVFMVCLPSWRFTLIETLESCFRFQRSWGSPYRVFPSLKGKLSLRTILSSHHVNLATLTRQLGCGFITRLHVQSFGPSMSPFF
jgi:hypothetical protein